MSTEPHPIPFQTPNPTELKPTTQADPQENRLPDPNPDLNTDLNPDEISQRGTEEIASSRVISANLSGH